MVQEIKGTLLVNVQAVVMRTYQGITFNVVIRLAIYGTTEHVQVFADELNPFFNLLHVIPSSLLPRAFHRAVQTLPHVQPCLTSDVQT